MSKLYSRYVLALLFIVFAIIFTIPQISVANENQTDTLKSEVELKNYDPDGIFTFGADGSLDLNGDALMSLEGVMMVLKYSTPQKGFDDKILLKIHESVEPNRYLPLKALLDERGYIAKLYFFSEKEKMKTVDR